METKDSKDKARASDGSSLRELIRNGSTAMRLFADERVPARIKLIPALALLYLLNPFDFIPDFGLGIGQLDDLAVIVIAIRLFIALAPEEIVAELRDERPDDLAIPADYRVQDEGIGY